MRGTTAFAVAVTLAGGLFAPSAQAAPLPDADPPVVSTISENATQVTTYQQKLAAGSTIDKRITDVEASMSDLKFTVWIYKWAERGSAIKREADKAMTNFDDELACYNFITAGIQVALREDILELSKRDARHTGRLKAAALVGWTNPSTQRLDGPLYDFVLEVSEKAEDRSEIESKARSVLGAESTDEQRQRFVVEGIYAADRVDLQRRVEEAERRKREEDELDRNLKARAAAWLIAGKAELTAELKIISDNDFTYKVFRTATGTRVRAAAQAALDNGDAVKIKAFIFTGVQTAHQADVADENAAQAAETEKRIKGIIDSARIDGYLPNVHAAATTALAGTLAERNAFINLGFGEAVKRDQIKPKHNLVVELQVKAADNKCAQIVGVDAQAIENGQATELWTCLRGPKQVWTLNAVNNDEYVLRNMHSNLCMDGHSEYVSQYQCDTNNGHHRWTFVANTDGSFQIRNVGTGKFVTAKDAGEADATNLVTYGNTNDSHQRWRIINVVHRSDVAQVDVGRYQLKGVESGRCLQTAGVWDRPDEGALGNLAGMELWDCVGGGKMAWDLVDLGDKRYALKNVMSGKCLDVKFGSWANGTYLIQFDCHYGGEQQFVFRATADGGYALENALTGKVADAFGHAVQNGAGIGIWDVTGLSNQRWTLHAA